MRALLVPIGGGSFDLYAEPPHAAHEHDHDHDAVPEGRLRRWLHAAGAKWTAIVETARSGTATSRFGRWRDEIVCRLAESIDEQRTLWALRTVTCGELLHPSGIDADTARETMTTILRAAQQHHGRWLAVDLTLFIASGILFFVPGPNIVAYYLGFRTFGHLQSWRGARQGLAATWTCRPSDDLSELGTLTGLPHEARAARVDAIGERLDMLHLAAFFERASR